MKLLSSDFISHDYNLSSRCQTNEIGFNFIEWVPTKFNNVISSASFNWLHSRPIRASWQCLKSKMNISINNEMLHFLLFLLEYSMIIGNTWSNNLCNVWVTKSTERIFR